MPAQTVPTQTVQPMMLRGIFGLAESDLPPAGIEGTAVWPVIESAPTRKGAGAITRVRRHLAWWSMRHHADTIDDLEMVNPPRWAARAIRRRRSKAGLSVATTR